MIVSETGSTVSRIPAKNLKMPEIPEPYGGRAGGCRSGMVATPYIWGLGASAGTPGGRLPGSNGPAGIWRGVVGAAGGLLACFGRLDAFMRRGAMPVEGEHEFTGAIRFRNLSSHLPAVSNFFPITRIKKSWKLLSHLAENFDPQF